MRAVLSQLVRDWWVKRSDGGADRQVVCHGWDLFPHPLLPGAALHLLPNL